MSRHNGCAALAAGAAHAEPHEELAQQLVHLASQNGPAAVAALRAALAHPDPWVRLHAVEGLAYISEGDDGLDAREALVAALHDASFGVHWAAAEALAASGQAGVAAVLRALLHDLPSTSFLHGVAYVLRHAPLASEERAAIVPVIDALDRPAADLAAPVLAVRALRRLEPKQRGTLADEVEPWYRIRRVRHGLHGHVLWHEV